MKTRHFVQTVTVQAVTVVAADRGRHVRRSRAGRHQRPAGGRAAAGRPGHGHPSWRPADRSGNHHLQRRCRPDHPAAGCRGRWRVSGAYCFFQYTNYGGRKLTFRDCAPTVCGSTSPTTASVTPRPRGRTTPRTPCWSMTRARSRRPACGPRTRAGNPLTRVTPITRPTRSKRSAGDADETTSHPLLVAAMAGMLSLTAFTPTPRGTRQRPPQRPVRKTLAAIRATLGRRRGISSGCSAEWE